MLRNGQEISSSSGWFKRSKTLQKWPFCHFLHQQEPVLGGCSFGGENDIQIETFHLGWIADIEGFPTRYHELNLDFRKFPKSRLKVARRIEKLGAAHRGILPKFHFLAQKSGQFD